MRRFVVFLAVGLVAMTTQPTSSLAECFQTPVPYGPSPNASLLTTSDVNADGRVDIIAGLSTPGRVEVRLRSVGGSYSAAIRYPLSSNPEDLCAADFDGDLDVDVAVRVAGSGIVIFLNNGSGLFTSTPPLPSSVGVGNLIVAGDVDLDGDNDLVVNSSGSIAVFHNLGAASFSSPQMYSNTYGGTSILLSLIDGDLLPDVVVAGDGFIVVMLNAGAGAYPASTAMFVGDYTYHHAIGSGDFDGDGDVDIVASLFNYGEVAVLFQQAGGSFGVPVYYGVGINPFGMTVANLDNDLSLDVASTSFEGDNLSILHNDGQGLFVSQSFVPIGDGPRAITSADLNNDGLGDLAATLLIDNQIVVVYGCPDPPDPPCFFQASDINCDGISNILDVVSAVDVAFRGKPEPPPCCP